VRRKSFALSAALTLGLLSGTAGAAPGAALAIITLSHTDDGLQIVGQALGLADATISGEMTISRKGKAGSVTTKQGGKVEIATGKKVDIAKVGVSYTTGDSLEIRLVLTQDGKIIAESKLSTGDP
jgi:hypothetical protein